MTNVRTLEAGHACQSRTRAQIGDELGGHMVSGHVDGLAELMAREDMTDRPLPAARAGTVALYRAERIGRA